MQSPSGGSVEIDGIHVPSGSGGVPVHLSSRFDGHFEVAIVPIVIASDLSTLLGDLDLANADAENGEILIDESHNRPLLTHFESKLGECAELEHDDER